MEVKLAFRTSSSNISTVWVRYTSVLFCCYSNSVPINLGEAFCHSFPRTYVKITMKNNSETAVSYRILCESAICTYLPIIGFSKCGNGKSR